MIRRPPRSTPLYSSAASDVYKRQTLDELRQSGEIVVEYHPVSILDRSSGGTAYSTRSATAAALVAAEAPEAFVAFHNALFTNQPAETSDTPYLTDAQLAEIARTAGVPE